MRVALTASLVSPIRKAEANGPHAVIVDLARGLLERGHDVAIYAAAGSSVSGVPVVEIDVPPGADRAAIRADEAVDVDARRALRRGFMEMFDAVRARGADVISQHAFDAPAFELARDMRVVHTLHLPPIDDDVVREARRTRHTLVTVSHAAAHAWHVAGVAPLIVIRNGVAAIAAAARTDPPFALICGRISPEKGTDVAIRCARAAGLPFRVVGDVYDRNYFERQVAPLLDASREPRPLPRHELAALMGRAAVTLMPVRWDETFGLVAAEAQMAGCPVVGYRRGALPEVVIEGIGGFLVRPDDESALADAIAPALALDRSQIRSQAQARLGIEPMISAYERLLVGIAGRRAAA